MTIGNALSNSENCRMGRNVTVSARIERQLDDRLRALANATGRSKGWHLAEALRGYLAADDEFVAAVAEGQRDYAAGRLVAHEVVKRRVARRMRQHRSKVWRP